MPNNNPAGTNSPVAFDRFTREIPYGEKKVQGDLQRTVPLAGQSAAATPLNLPRQAGRAAKRAATAPLRAQAAAPPTAAVEPSTPSPPPSVAETWQMLTRLPGVSPLAFDYAERAAQT